MVGTGAAEARAPARRGGAQSHLLGISAGRCAASSLRTAQCVPRAHRPDVLSQAGSQRCPRWCPEGRRVSILAIEAPSGDGSAQRTVGARGGTRTSAAGRSWEGFLQAEAFEPRLGRG